MIISKSETLDLKNEEKITFLQLIRDADKLDIWRIFSEYYESSKHDRASAAGLGLPDLPEYSVFLYACIKKSWQHCQALLH